MFDALFDVKIDNLVRLAVEASRVREPGPAFRGFLLGVIEARATDRGLGVVVMRTGRGNRSATELGQRLAPIVERLISRARTAGEVREEFTGQDVCILSLMVGAVADNTRDIDPRIWRRYAQILIDGTGPTDMTEPLLPAPPAMEASLVAAAREALGHTAMRQRAAERFRRATDVGRA